MDDFEKLIELQDKDFKSLMDLHKITANIIEHLGKMVMKNMIRLTALIVVLEVDMAKLEKATLQVKEETEVEK